MSKRKHKHSARNKGRLLPFIKIHRWAGLSSFILLAVVSMTGIMLNHTEELNLNERYINTQWLQTWYGIKMPNQQRYIKLDDSYFAQLGRQLYFNQTRLPDEESPLIGGYKTENFMILGMREALYLLTPDGELIERLDSQKNLPVPISRIGLTTIKADAGQLILEVDNQYYTSRDDFLTWTKIQSKEFYPLLLNTPDAVNNEFYRNAYLGNELTLERVLLDLHSGRLLGSFGVYLMDIAAVILLILGLSGTWIWSRRLRKK
jgi:hypothetical protein